MGSSCAIAPRVNSLGNNVIFKKGKWFLED